MRQKKKRKMSINKGRKGKEHFQESLLSKSVQNATKRSSKKNFIRLAA